MSLSAFDAAWWEAILQGQGGSQSVTGMVASNNHIIVPAGTYYQTIDAVFSGGKYEGKGCGVFGREQRHGQHAPRPLA